MLAYLTLPKRAFDSIIMKSADFEDGSYVHLFKLNRPYANGVSYAIYETTKNPFCSNKLIKEFKDAKRYFDLMIRNGSYQSRLVKEEHYDN